MGVAAAAEIDQENKMLTFNALRAFAGFGQRETATWTGMGRII
jgi:hypothetical protein